MLRRLTPNVERLWSMAEVAGGRMPKAPRAIREPLGNVNGPQSIRWPKSRFQIILLCCLLSRTFYLSSQKIHTSQTRPIRIISKK